VYKRGSTGSHVYHDYFYGMISVILYPASATAARKAWSFRLSPSTMAVLPEGPPWRILPRDLFQRGSHVHDAVAAGHAFDLQ
jgi:hypothetical protein